jgi:YebC/PmpR family DNA-binding regulatory protein
MGRAFEFRKARKMKRWGQMAKTFTKIGKEISIAVKNGGPDPQANLRLRALIQNARAANMPKENIERAIKKASAKDEAEYKEMVYEGYGPHGIAIMVETATDNPTRTVANVRACFSKYGGSLGTSGSVEFLFERKCVFRLRRPSGLDLEAFEFEMIDYGVEEIGDEDEELVLYGPFETFGAIQKALEDRKLEIISSEFERMPLDTKELGPEAEAEVEKLIDRLQEDDDVVNVFHTMR